MLLLAVLSLVACNPTANEAVTTTVAQSSTEVASDESTAQNETTSSVETTAPDETTVASALTCAQCGKAVSADSKFCNDCGAALEPEVLTCQSCGVELVAGSKFCNKCGSAVGEVAETTSQSGEVAVTAVVETTTVAQTSEAQIVDGMTDDFYDYIVNAKVLPSRRPMLDDTLYKSLRELEAEGHQLNWQGDQLIFDNPDKTKPSAVYMKPLAIDADVNSDLPIYIFSSTEGVEMIEGVRVGCEKSLLDNLSMYTYPVVLRESAEWTRYRYNLGDIYMYVITEEVDGAEIARTIEIQPRAYPPLSSNFPGETPNYYSDNDDELLAGIDIAGAFLMNYKRIKDTGRFDALNRDENGTDYYDVLMPNGPFEDSIAFYFSSTDEFATPLELRIGGETTASPDIEMFDGIYVWNSRAGYDEDFGEPVEINDIDDELYECVYYVKYNNVVYRLRLVFDREKDISRYFYVMDMNRGPY